MAVIKAVSSKAGIGHAIDYVTKKEKTEEKLVSGLHCEPETVKEEMQATKELWGKTDGRTYKHYVQSYHEDEEITPEQAHKNAVELAEHTKAWKGHEVLIATHIDKGHIHTHFIVNSVNYENGHKLQWSKHDLKDLKERCNEQSWEQGLHVPEKGKTFAGEVREETVAWSKDTYQLLKQAEQGKVKSYVQDIALAVLDCKETATSRETFIRLMNERGYGVDWQDSHKYITYTALMSDFGTALIFFVAFLCIAFLRTGDLPSIVMITAAAGFAGGIVLRFKPYVLARFAVWRHAWEYAQKGGYQQTRTMSAVASGGLFGAGPEEAWLKYVGAANTDLVFGVVSEEFGLLLALCAAAAVILLGIYALRAAGRSRSSFYAIAACATAAMLVFQTTLNVLGSVDLLPLTGVTFPFVSMGGSSMLSCWGLLAYLQAAAPPPVSVKAAPKAPAPAVKPPQATGFLDELGVATDDIFGKEDAR